MPQMEFEPTNPVFERAETVHALHREATVKKYLFPVITLVSVRNLLPSKGRCLQSRYLGMGLHATIHIPQTLFYMS
jgi:hypothetical protein